MMLSLFFICLAVLQREGVYQALQCVQVSVVRADNATRVHSKVTRALKTGSGQAFIVGGQPAVDGQFPWQVALTLERTYLCGGAVLSHSFVLTAAHCLPNSSNIESLVMIFGSLSRLNMEVTRQAAELIAHENFWSSLPNITNDIGLVRLDSKLPEEWTALLAPIRLPRLSHVSLLDDELVDVSGWGRTSSEIEVKPDNLLWTRMKVMPLTSCAEKVFECLNISVTQAHICTSTSEGHAVYKGDSGSPLVWRDAEDIPRVVGIVSAGSQTAEIGVPNVFTRVSHFLDWIQKHSDVVVDS